MVRSYISLSLAFLAVSGCNIAEKHERFRGMAVLGPHGPEFYPEMEFRIAQDKIYPWRMSGIGQDFRPRLDRAERNAVELGISSFPWITVEFLGEEIIPRLNTTPRKGGQGNRMGEGRAMRDNVARVLRSMTASHQKSPISDVPDRPPFGH
jgi:hypothetical protein